MSLVALSTRVPDRLKTWCGHDVTPDDDQVENYLFTTVAPGNPVRLESCSLTLCPLGSKVT